MEGGDNRYGSLMEEVVIPAEDRTIRAREAEQCTCTEVMVASGELMASRRNESKEEIGIATNLHPCICTWDQEYLGGGFHISKTDV